MRNTAETSPFLPAGWSQLSPEQKREQRISWWQSSIEEIKFVDEAARTAYRARMQRMIDVYDMREPDRVPVMFHLSQLPFLLYGVDFHAGIYDYGKAVHVSERFNTEHASELDCYFSPALILPGKVLDMLDYRLYKWPGHGLPNDNIEYQFVEGEYMKADEYDDLIQNPSDFWMRVYLPRIFGAFESFRMLDSFTDIIEIPLFQSFGLTRPEVLDTLQKIIDAGKELQKRASFMEKVGNKGLELGYPPVPWSGGKAPFDVIGDTLRGTQGVIMDMYRRPDKLLEALDVVANLIIKSAISHANESKAIMVMFPLHKGADGWMSEKQFEKFYWPSLKKVINAIISEGLIMSLFAEGSYNTRLESINEFPRGAVNWSFDQTDMAEAKKILGDRCSIQGNVPSSLLVTGTPAQVKEHCRKLIETCGKGGGYILAAGADGSTAKLDNLKAMVEAAKEYGVYRKPEY